MLYFPIVELNYLVTYSYVNFIIINHVGHVGDFAELFICNNVFMLCNTYNTCNLTIVLMYYTILIVAVPCSLDLLIFSFSLLFASVLNLHVTFCPPHCYILTYRWGKK